MQGVIKLLLYTLMLVLICAGVWRLEKVERRLDLICNYGGYYQAAQGGYRTVIPAPVENYEEEN